MSSTLVEGADIVDEKGDQRPSQYGGYMPACLAPVENKEPRATRMRGALQPLRTLMEWRKRGGQASV